MLDAPFAKATAAVVKSAENVDDCHRTGCPCRAFEKAVDRDLHRDGPQGVTNQQASVHAADKAGRAGYPLSILFTTHDNLIGIGMFLEIDRSRLDKSQPFVIDRNVSAIDAGPVPSLDHQMIGTSGTV
jgi:hypothetical protein